MTIERIEKLPCWRNRVTIEPLSGGITNRNYLVHDAPQRYVARLCEDLRLLGIDRRNELACQRAAAECGVAPEVVHDEPGVVVSRFVAGQTLTPDDVRDAELLARLAASLRQLHDAWDRLRGELLYFSAFQTVRTYTATARRLGATLPADIDRLVADADRLERHMSPFTPTLCHNDLLAANLIADEGRVWLVDWEYAGIGNPLFDLAGVAGNCELTPQLEAVLLESYYGRVPANAARELRILKTVSLLREALWAVIQTVASDLDFDYPAYAQTNFEAYQRAREQLAASLP